MLPWPGMSREGTTNGTPIQLWSNGASNEQWQAVYLRTDGNGHNVYKFIAQNSGLCLDVPGASSANGQQLDEFACNGTNAQAFTLTPVTPAAGNPAQPTAPAATVPDAPSNSQAPNNNGQGTAPNNGQGTAPNSQPSPAVFRDSTAIHTIKSVNSGLCVDVLGGFTHSTLVQWPCNVQDDAQWWQFYAGPNFANYTIADPLVNNNVWDVAGGPQVTWNQAGIDVWDFNQQTNQKWAICPQGNNMFTFCRCQQRQVPGCSLFPRSRQGCNWTNLTATERMLRNSLSSTILLSLTAALPFVPTQTPRIPVSNTHLAAVLNDEKRMTGRVL